MYLTLPFIYIKLIFKFKDKTTHLQKKTYIFFLLPTSLYEYDRV